MTTPERIAVPEALSDDELSAVVWRELERPVRTILRARLVALPIGGALVLGLLLLEGGAWRLWTFGIAVVVIGLVLVRDAIALRRIHFTPGLVPYILAPIILVHTAIITVTGGARSPFLVLYAVIGLVPAVVFGRARPFLAWAAFPLSLLWAFSVGEVTGWLPSLAPRVLGGDGPGPNGLWLYFQATVFTLSCLAGGAVILLVRAALARTTRRVAAVRQELVDSGRERHKELMVLASELAHELKNPLASIQGLSTLVARRLEPGTKDKEHMDVLVSEVKRMAAVLDELLNFSRPLSALATRRVTPAELVAEVVLLHEGLAEQRGVTLELAQASAPDCECDRRKITQVLANLLHNALEATPRGGRVVASCEAGAGGAVRFVVEDTGPGLDGRVRKRLFEPGVTTKPEGSGIGLTIARAIAEQHGGSLRLDDAAQGGCRAVLELLAAPPRSPRPEEP